jgi:hypothetical protein
MSRQRDKSAVYDLSNIAEALFNLTFLIREESDQPDKVRRYVGMCEEKLRIMVEKLRDLHEPT